MPVVHKLKSRARDHFGGTPSGRGRRANGSCSRFVLVIAAAVSSAVEVNIDLQTVICQVPSVSRESVAAAKLQQPADASSTIWGLRFKQA
jgi:hypothetical protein